MGKRRNNQPTGFALLATQIKPLNVKLLEPKWSGPVVCEFADGWNIRELSFPDDYQLEGALMGHCLGLMRDHYRKYSCWHLEDKFGVPHATIVAWPGGEHIYEIRGRNNNLARADYRVLIQTFLDREGILGDDTKGSVDDDDRYHEDYITDYIITGMEGVYGD